MTGTEAAGTEMTQRRTEGSWEEPPRGELPRGVRREIVSFARRDGRVHPKIARAWREHHEALLVTPERLERDASLHPGWRFDPQATFGRCAPLVVEVGSGTGAALLASAAAHPELNYLGVEVYRPGVAKTVLRAHRRQLRNVRVLQADAAALLRTGLSEGCVHELWVFFPDPWHKVKHHKRRLVTAAFLADAARAVADGGVVRTATDCEGYAVHMLRVAGHVAAFDNPYRGFAPRFAGRPMTHFELKGLAAGRVVRDLHLVRRPRRLSGKNST